MPRLKCELTFSQLSTISNIAKSTINVISGKENSLSSEDAQAIQMQLSLIDFISSLKAVRPLVGEKGSL